MSVPKRPLAFLLALSLAPAGAAQESGREGQRRVLSEGPGGKTLEIAAGPGSVLGKDELLLKEYVDIRFGETRLQADFVRYTPSTREAYAEGNVILDLGPARLTAESLLYNLESETGTFFNARGYAEPSIYFEAKRVEKISKDEMVLHDATFTACTQPIPYWSFKVGRGLVRLEDYAYLHNLSFKIGRATIFYSPYLVWPVKSDRAAGLLLPQFGFSSRGGTVISSAYYWPMRRNMDATYFLDYLSKAGWGQGLEYRYVPSETGRGHLTGFYLRDRVEIQEDRPGVPVDRWAINYAHQQSLASGWRVLANANLISDFSYYQDYARDIRLSTNPQAISNLFVTRDYGFYALNVRGERRELLQNVLIEPIVGQPFGQSEEQVNTSWIQPEIEVRGRRQRLGRTPLYMTLEASADWLRKGDLGADYQRFDLYPVLSSRLSPVPWMDVDASLGLRETYYTQSQRGDLGCDDRPGTGDFGEGNQQEDFERDLNADGVFDAADDVGCDSLPGTGDFGEGNGVRDREDQRVFDEGLNRSLYQAGLTLIGPKMSRVFDTPRSGFSPQYKNTIEPTIRYTYTSEFDRLTRVIPFDEIDPVGVLSNRLSFGVVARLFAKRSPGEMEQIAGPGAGATYVGGGLDPLAPLRDQLQREKARQAAEAAPPAGGAPPGPPAGLEPPKKSLNTVEVATLEITQDYSFLGPLSTSDALGRSLRFSAINAVLRVNPSLRTSLDLRTTFDILFNDLRDVGLSANFRSPRHGFIDLTWALHRDLEGQARWEKNKSFAQPFSPNQIGLQGETSLFARRVLLGAQINYELGDVRAGEPRLRDQRYKFGYNTQCCGFQFELLNRNYSGFSSNEVRFLVNLKGVGNVIDLHQDVGGYGP